MEKWLRFIFLTLLIALFCSALWAGWSDYTSVPNNFLLPMLLAVWSFDFFRESVFFLGSYFDRMIKMKLNIDLEKTEYLPKVSIIVPAFNEEAVIAKALEGLYYLDYPDYEIVFVDDGSSDNTLSIAQEVATHHPEIQTQIISQANAGKSAALNNGIRHATSELVLCVDSDSKITPLSLKNGVRHFQDEKVAAVGGFVHIANRINWLTEFQHLEYLVAIQFQRRTLSLFGMVTVVPGPIGMFRKSVILELGGYETGGKTFAEDAELTIRMLTAGWLIRSDESMVSITEAPENLNAFFRQRYRWIRGIYQASWENINTLLFEKGWHGKLVATHLLYESTVSIIINVCLTLMFLSSFLSTGDAKLLGIWVFYTVAMDAIRTLIVSESFRDLMFGLVTILPRRLFFNYILQTWAIFCLIDEWLGEGMSWDKLERTGNLGG